MGAEALNYDYDVIDTPTETPTTDKIVRCFTDSELNDELANLLKDSLSGVRKANLEDHGLEIRKRNRELIIREKKKQKLLSIVELSMMIFVLLLVPVLGTVIVRELLANGYKPNEIQNALGLTSKQYFDNLTEMRNPDNTNILKGWIR